MLVPVSPGLKAALQERGVESFHSTASRISDEAVLEPPCGIKWLQIEAGFDLGAFSYGVSGYCSHATIGRYTSIGEAVQIGRSSHPLSWVSTSPFLYLRQKMFDVGCDFEGADAYHNYLPPARIGAAATALRRITIGNDVYIGHGVTIMPGVTVNDGAILAAMAVVTKDVPPYAVVGGNPARVIRMRLPLDQAAALRETAWWRFAPWQLTDIDLSSPLRAIPALRRLVTTATPYQPQPIHVRDLIASNPIST